VAEEKEKVLGEANRKGKGGLSFSGQEEKKKQKKQKKKKKKRRRKKKKKKQNKTKHNPKKSLERNGNDESELKGIKEGREDGVGDAERKQGRDPGNSRRGV